MQDRVSASPGRVLITPESGEAYYATIERADNPTVEGTPLNKASLLTDATASDYGISANATPNDALQALKTNHRPWRVGDILDTVRTDLGSKWLLCNGSYIESSDYPELYSVLPKVSSISKTAGLTSITCCFHANGYWVIGGKNSSNKPAIAYTSDTIKETWSVRTLSLSGSDSSGSVCGISYADGKWAIFGGSNTTAYIWHATVITGSFTVITWKDNSGRSIEVKAGCYGNGYWSIVLEIVHNNYFYCLVLYTDDLEEGNLSQTDVLITTSVNTYNGTSVAFGIVYAAGYWCVARGIANSGFRIYYTNSISGTWSYYDAINDSNGIIIYNFYCFCYAHNYFIVCGNSLDTKSHEGKQFIAYSTSPNATWKKMTGNNSVNTSTFLTEKNVCFNYVDYINGKFVFVGKYNAQYGYAYATSLTNNGTLSFTTITPTSDNGGIYVMPSGDICQFAYHYTDSNITTLLRNIPSASNIAAQLPTISISNARAYIRAEE